MPVRLSWPQMELRWRLSLVLGLLLTAALSAGAVVAVGDARVAVADEVNASLRTATANLDLTLALLRGRPPEDVEAALRLWGAAYAGGRHLCVAIDLPDRETARCDHTAEVRNVPAWFARGAEIVEPPVVHEVPLGAGQLRVRLVPDPRDELREAWARVRGLLLLIGLLAFSANLCIFLALSHGLRPLQRLMAAMQEIGRGNPMPALPEAGALEVRTLASGLRELSRRLTQGRDDLRALHLRSLELQEEERRIIARDLHDEIGQHVTAIEMEVIRIGRLPASDAAQREERLRQIRQSVTEIHRVSRGLVHRLKPPAIERLGLAGALAALFDRWRDDFPELELHACLEPGCEQLAGERAIHVYRIVQESLSNVARHAQAKAAWVRIGRQDECLAIRVTDDGRGFDPEAGVRGYGLAGMRERIEALAGSFRVRAKPGMGSVVEASIPLRATAPDDAAGGALKAMPPANAPSASSRSGLA